MKTVADPDVLHSLTRRLGALNPESPRRWGTLTPHEMLCHVGDTAAMVLGTRPPRQPLPMRSRPVLKLIGLWSPLPWLHGRPTDPMQNPKAQGTKPSEFAKDMARAIAGLEAIAVAGPGSLEPMHGVLGTMSVRDWQRWAYRHSDHHLRQFGV
jgi:hypothetical protein